MLFRRRARNLDWFEADWAAYLGLRAETFRTALTQLLARSGEDRTIVETGCTRLEWDAGDGSSTLLLGEFVRRHGGRLHTVDINPSNMATCRRLTRRDWWRISYHVADSVGFLSTFARRGRRIDLLYLDSFDYPLGADEDAGRDSAQRHCLAELEAALPALSPRALVLFDDAALPGGGKPRLASERLRELGWTCVAHVYQTLFVR